MASNMPAKIGKYDVLDVIGRGGMGVVYKATDPHLDRLVAIKMMTTGFADNPDLLKRFFREAQSLGSLQHPNIVTVYDLGDYSGNPYLVMEYLEGDGLDSVFTNRRQLSLLEKTSIIIQVCNGLSYAHKRGVVHRDIKPANIMLAKDGGVKIFDFGIAHIGDQSVTKTGQIVGTLSYMSPEQVNGKQIDARTDLFSTGVVLYQLFTNHLPFEGESTATTLLKIIYDPPPPLKNFLSSYPPELETILLRALAKDREERYHSAEELGLDLSQLQGQLKQELIAQHLKEVGVFLERSDLYKAKEYLLQVLKTDPQHTQATQLLREVQQRIKREEVTEQVRKLRQRAEEAVAREQFEIAQESLEQAINLDKNNPDLERLRESVRAAAQRAQKLHDALKVAESAHQDGDLDTAKQAVEEALQIAPDDTQAKALYRVIHRDWVERSRQRQLENYLYEARQDISSRKFTAALELLKLAEALDPSAPQVHALIESAAAGREQERRRKDLEAISRDIEDALNRDDYRGACLKADEGLARFPEERTLLKLKALADRQRQIEERKQFIDEQLAIARKLLQESRNEELLQTLEAALAKIGPEPRLQSLLTIVRENVQRERMERRKAEFLQKAKESLRTKEYDSAVRTLESARAELKNEPEIEDLLQFVKEEAAADRHRRIAEAAAEKVHGLVAEQKYDEAIRLLETTLREAPDEELRIVLAETRRAAADYQQKLEAAVRSAEKLLQARKPNEALKLLESQPSSHFRDPALVRLLDTARAETERMRRVDEAIEQSRRTLESEDYAGARRLLEECRAANGTGPELDAQVAAIEERRVTAATKKVEKTIGDARILTMATEYQPALDKLQAVSDLVASIPAALRAEYNSLQQQSANGLVHQRKTQIERFVAAGDLTRASELLRQSLAQFPADRDLSSLNNVLSQETAKRADAQEGLAEAQRLFARMRWKEGGDLLKKAFASSTRAPIVREQILDTFVQAGVSAVESDWRAADALLQQLSELKSDYATPSVLRARIRERKREEFVNLCTTQAKRLLAAGDLQGALREVTSGLTSYPEDSTLKDLKDLITERSRQEEERLRVERARLEKEAYLRDVNQRTDREPALDRRITILDEALLRYPDEPRLQQQANTVRELWKQVSALASEARAFEDTGKYGEALAQWNAIRNLHSRHPDVDSHIARVQRLQEQARTASKANWRERIQTELAASNFDQARALLVQAAQEFPGDRDFSQLEELLLDKIRLRSKAQKLLGDATKHFEQSRWEKGLDVFNRAMESAGHDAVVRDQGLKDLVRAADSALAADLGFAQILASRALTLQPSSPLIPALQRRIEDGKREQAIVQILNKARRGQQAGDLQGALQELTRGLASYPDDQRFIQSKNEIETQLRQLEEQREREREKARLLERERERERERARQLQIERERELEKQRQQEAEQRRIREQEEERKRQEQIERERIRAKEQEEQRSREREQARLLQIERERELEKQRQQEAEQRRIREQEEERKRQEELERQRVRAKELEAERERERKRLEALEQERVKAEEREREQARIREIEAQREREAARQRALEIERQRQEAEKAKLEEAKKLREEAQRKEEQMRLEREQARLKEQQRKEQEKARKREERERKQAEAAEQKRKEKEAALLQEKKLQEERAAQKRREEEAAKKAREQQIRAEASKRPLVRPESEEDADPSATRVLGSTPARDTKETSHAPSRSRQEGVPKQKPAIAILDRWQALNPSARRSMLGVVALLVLAAAGLTIWKIIQPSTTIKDPTTYTIQVTTTPEGSTVTVSPVAGQKKQECVTPACTLSLLPGRYAVDVRHEGYETAEQTVEVASDGPRALAVSLKPIVANLPPPSPRVEVRGLPAGAEVFVDVKSIGKVGKNGEISSSVDPGDHKIKVVAKNQKFDIIQRTFEAGHVVSLGRDDFALKPSSPERPQPEPVEADWIALGPSPTIGAVERYLNTYSNGPHSNEARNLLDNLTWNSASQSNSANDYQRYVDAFPNGTHIGEARDEIAFRKASDHRDPATLNDFVREYPSSKHVAEIRSILTDLDDGAWGRVHKADEKSLSSYLTTFPSGRHADEAHRQLQELRNLGSTKPPVTTQPTVVVAPPIDDSKAILAVLAQYQKAYNDRNITLLQSVWPGMPPQFAANTQTFFNDATSVTLTYNVTSGPTFSGDEATITFNQTISAAGKEGKGKSGARVVMKLNKTGRTQGPLGGWQIESLK